MPSVIRPVARPRCHDLDPGMATQQRGRGRHFQGGSTVLTVLSMSRREPDRKVHRFTSWWALFILKIEKVLEGSLAPSVVDSRYRMPLNYPGRCPRRPQCLDHRSCAPTPTSRPHSPQLNDLACRPTRDHDLRSACAPQDCGGRGRTNAVAGESLSPARNKYLRPNKVAGARGMLGVC
jgi:hypothetical protein